MMSYAFCGRGETLAVIFDREEGGFCSCAADVLFPCLLFTIALIRIIMLKPQCSPRCCSCWSPFSKHTAAAAAAAQHTPNRSMASGCPYSSPHQTDHVNYSGVAVNEHPAPVGEAAAAADLGRRSAKWGSVGRMFVWLQLLMPFHSLLLLVIRVTLAKEQLLLVWPVSILLLFASWWTSTFCLEVEVSRALDKSSSPKFRHSPILLLFWGTSLIYESVPIIDLIVAHEWKYPLHDAATNTKSIVMFGLWCVRFTSVIVILILGFIAPGLPRRSRPVVHSAGEGEDQQGLFGKGEKKLTSEEDSTFKNFFLKMKFLWPYIWPKNEPRLQINVVLCFILLILGRLVNICIPIFYSKLVTRLSQEEEVEGLSAGGGGGGGESSSGGVVPWAYISLYCGFYFMSGSGFGGSGFLSNIRSLLWINVQQYSMRTTMVEIFSHLHSLSLRWHLGRKTGEVLGVIDRGNNSVVTLLNYILFTILPTIADILIAIVYFVFAFNLYFGLIVFGCLSAYVAATITISEWRTKFRREVNRLDNASRTKAVDSLINFETVKYYGAEKYEVERYERSLLSYQEMQWNNLASLQLLNLVQIVIVNMGLFAGCLLCAYYIIDHHRSVGTFVLYTTYIVQLYGPLNFLGTWFRMIQQSFIDMENMLDLFMECPEVQDKNDCTPLVISGGEIEFEQVCFHYTPEKPILSNVSFKVPAGKTVAIVGPSGGGKSTIIRLLFRFYDIHSGRISIDGEDISRVSQQSLRSNIGVVPQDTVLFNDTIRYNIEYGRHGADEKDIYEAAARADIHARIEQFPDQYETLVGERGLKLSGGEKQRVAIARTVLKAPKVILLDEATSALDTKTERNIQSALDDVSKDRTTLVVAHRLSTVVNADMIMVLKDGVIVERGTHQELLDTEGSVYGEMWSQQATSFVTEMETLKETETETETDKEK